MSTQMAGQRLLFSTLDNTKCVQVLWINSNWSIKVRRVDRGLAATVHLCTLNTRVHSAFLNGFCPPFIGICYSSSLVHGIAIATVSLWQMHCYNTTQGKHTTQFASVFETVSVSAIRSVSKYTGKHFTDLRYYRMVLRCTVEYMNLDLSNCISFLTWQGKSFHSGLVILSGSWQMPPS